MLNDNDLAYMRGALNELLPATCHILTVTRVSDGQGWFTETWGTATANVACRLDYQSGIGMGRESVIGGALQTYSGFVITLPHDTTLEENNRIKIGSTEYNVTVYGVRYQRVHVARYAPHVNPVPILRVCCGLVAPIVNSGV